MSPVTFPLAAAERDRERELRARFAKLWNTPSGDSRTRSGQAYGLRRSGREWKRMQSTTRD